MLVSVPRQRVGHQGRGSRHPLGQVPTPCHVTCQFVSDAQATHAPDEFDPGQVLDAMADAVVVVDHSGMIRLMNERLLELTGYQRAELSGASIELLVPEAMRAGHRRLRADAHGEEGLHRPMGSGRDIVLRRADGTEIPVDIALSQLDEHVVASVRDARAARVMATALEEEKRRAAVLAERARIARDLHDGIIQQLFAIGLGIRAAGPSALDGKGSDVVARIDDAIRDLRAYVTGMHAESEPRSLLGSFTDLLAQLRAVSPAPIEPTIDPRIARLLTVHTQILLNFAREALTNAIRHSGAKRIELTLGTRNREAILEIIDNGRGFDRASLPGKGAGLPNLAARAAAIGGHLELESRLGSGTRVALRIPLAGLGLS